MLDANQIRNRSNNLKKKPNVFDEDRVVEFYNRKLQNELLRINHLIEQNLLLYLGQVSKIQIFYESVNDSIYLIPKLVKELTDLQYTVEVKDVWVTEDDDSTSFRTYVVLISW